MPRSYCSICSSAFSASITTSGMPFTNDVNDTDMVAVRIGVLEVDHSRPVLALASDTGVQIAFIWPPVTLKLEGAIQQKNMGRRMKW